jgi:TonB family protein
MKHLALALVLAIGAAAPVFAAIKPPEIISGVVPDYPQSMKDRKIAGQVTVSVVIDVYGNVQDAKVVKASDDAFSEPALTAVKQWTFKPAERDGKAVAMRVEIPINFKAPAGDDAKPKG